MALVIRGGTVIDPLRGIEEQADVWVQGDTIAGIGPPPAAADWEVVDAGGLVVCPGLIDIHVHLREPGGEHKETVATGTRAAVAGGFTTVCAMPNTSPPVDRPERVADLQQRVSRCAHCRVHIIGAATLDNAGREVSDFPAMARAGCVAMTDDAFPLQTADIMRTVLQAAAECGLPLIAHCEDEQHAAGGVMNRGAVSEALGLPGQDCNSEPVSLRRWSDAAGADGAAHLHVAHASSAGLLREVGRLRGAPGGPGRITVETAPHYFTLTEKAVRDAGPNAKMNPPLRTEPDRRAVRAALMDGEITVIATDHAPHAPEEKARGMMDAPFGIVGLETALGVTLTELVQSGDMSLAAALALMTCNPAEVLGLKDGHGRPLGRLAPGMPADLTLIDPGHKWVVDPDRFHSLGRNTPFAGRRLTGRAWGTVVAGRVKMQEYEVVGEARQD